MKGVRFISLPKGMKWEEFSEKYAKFFRISNPSKRREALKAQWIKMGGKDPDIKTTEFKPSNRRGKVNPIPTEAETGND